MASDSSGNKLLDCFVDVFSYTVLLKKTCAITQPTFEEVNGKLRQLVNDTAQRMVTLGVDARDYDEARFAVCAWVDETIMNIPWRHREEWQRSLLQSEYYSTMNAGSEFFDRLNSLHAEQNDVREIYYLCLGLGFMGRYSLEGDQFLLEQLKKSNLRSLTGKVSEPLAYGQERMFDDAYQPEQSSTMLRLPEALRPKPGGRWKLWLWGVPPVVVIGLFLVYTFVLNGVVDNLMIHVVEG